MNAMLFGLVDQAICVRLTETLLHFVWEGLVIGLGTMVAAWLFRTATAKTRYTIHAIAFVLLALSADHFFVDRFTLRSFDQWARRRREWRIDLGFV